MSDAPTVFVVDDDEAVRRSIGLLLGSVALPAETFASAADFLASVGPERPGCLVLDLRMPGMSGLELQRELTDRGHEWPIVFVTAHGDVPDAVQAMRGGAVDFIQKPFRDQELLDRVQAALELDAAARERAGDHRQLRERRASLTGREGQVMERVVAGEPNKAIAAELGISERTVEIHRARVMSKMGARSLAELVKLALRCEAEAD